MIIQGKVWGCTSPIFNTNNVEAHYIEINKGGYCSNHKHQHKYNKFIILDGELQVTISKDYGNGVLQDITILGKGQEITVNPGEYHQFEALQDTQALEFYWVELNPTDIVRLTHGGVNPC